MVGKNGINDPPLFAYDRDSATEVLSAAGSKTKTHKSAMEVSMPNTCMQPNVQMQTPTASHR